MLEELNTLGFQLRKETILLRSMKLPRKEAWTFIIASISVLVCLYLDDNRLGFGPVGVVGTVIFGGLMLTLGFLHLLPERFLLYGIEIKDDGFFFHHQLRRTKFIRYESIYRIVASSMIDGGGESACTLRVKSLDGNARLEENILYGTEILERLKSLPGFNNEAWSQSDVPEDSLLWAIIAKKTVLLERRIPS
ncbi:hypothetical protein ACO0K0_13620 [Undibacterium sp. SXout11W]|uniref:hypothetical protein n=1 Tax=Undibacterium sp. SXout11W TaxID=3413050 RepID=UPI003BF3B036